jgi:hypothetical protein
MTLLREALVYLDMGWCVYPAHRPQQDGSCSCGNTNCPYPGKHPVGHWLEYQKQLPTKDEVVSWFSVLDCNVGSITGQVSGMAVVDVDGEKGKESLETLDLAPTLTARTGGGGLHLFYSTSKAVPSRVKVLDGIDIRGEGAYVVLAPSLHRSGRYYKWDVPVKMAEYDPTPFEKYGVPISSGASWAEGLLQGVELGSRSISAARLSGRYFSIGLSLQETWILMSAWNERNTPPLTESELRRSVKSMHRKHLEQSMPQQVTTLGQIRKLLQRGGR